MKKILLALMAFGAFNTWEVNAAGDGTVCKSIDEAISTGNLTEVIRFVEEEGIDVNAKLYNGTLLHAAAGDGHLDIVRYLCEHGADGEKENHDHLPPIYLAACYGQLEVVKYLYDKYYADDPSKDDKILEALTSAAECGHLEVVKYLASQRNLDINQGDSTPLTAAARQGHLDVVKYLVEELHANVEAKDRSGSTALIDAAWQGHLDVLRYLCEECNANVDAVDNSGESAIIKAYDCIHLDVIKYLYETQHANIYATNRNGKTIFDRVKNEKYRNADLWEYLNQIENQ